ncbi:CotH kinase family protein [Streptomyces sp. NPDC096132]|uniref:CotH kinase family protein n=1 Tax=Streptomyces sp. NPDC096132 TaxID=3366075 RepID=UPI003817A0D0
MAGPRRRLVHRLPLRLRHHWKPAALAVVGLSVLLIALGDVRVTPFVTSASRADADEIVENVTGTVDPFDTSTAHSIVLEYDQTDYDDMMAKYQEDGEKEYIEADLTIDGVYLNDVGIRLKGNSTLQSLRGGGRGAGPGGGAAGAAGEGMQQGGMPEGGPQQNDGQQQNGGQAEGGQTADGRQQPQGGGMGGAGGGMTQYDLSASKPEELPWLISIDEYVEGRAYEGHREISLRPGVDEALPVNEALALSLMKKSGQAAEDYAFTSVQVNNRSAVTRLMVENPSKDYVDAKLPSTGVAYKARAGGSFDYVGDDPTDYEKSFKQLNLKGSQDLSPVMRLLRWTNEASDTEFAEELDQYVDVDSFAEYVATQNLIMNFDDMAGPGNNYVLWYDLDTGKFSVLGWDFNLTFSGSTDTGPDDSVSMGGGGGGGAPQGMGDETQQGMPNGQNQNGGPPQDGQAGDSGQGRGGGMGGNILKERFLETDAFDTVYHQAYKKLYEQFYGSGYALEALDTLGAQAKKAGADASGVTSTVKSLRSTVTARTESLAKNEVVTG